MKRHKASPHCEVDAIHWSQYLDGEFSSARCRQCEAHLAECVECRAKLRDVRRTVTALKAAARQPLPRAVQAAARERARTIAKRAR
jgi:anti-sigma factor RsiW